MLRIRNHFAIREESGKVCRNSKSRDIVEIHFNAQRVLVKSFQKALMKSGFSGQSEYFRFKMRELVETMEAKERTVERSGRQ
jgi:hypothetical protein